MTIFPFKLLKNISLFDKSERTAFRKFLRSPFYNQQPELRNLFEYILSELPIFFEDTPPINRSNHHLYSLHIATAFAHLYPTENTKKNAQQQKTKLNNLCSDLIKSIETFIAASRQKEDLVQRYLYCAEFALLKKEETFWKSAMRKCRTAIDALGDGQQARNYHYRYLKLEFESPFFDRLHKTKTVQKLGEIMDAQHSIHLLTQLIFACSLVYGKEVSKLISEQHAQEEFFQHLLSETSVLDPDQHPLAYLYRQLILLKLEKGDLQQCEMIFSLVVKYQKRIQLVELNEVVRYLLNYFISKRNITGDKAYLEKRLEVELWAIRKGVLLRDGLIPDVLFLNACTNATSLGRYDLLEEYVTRHSIKLERRKISSAVALVKAGGLFHQQQFELANDELQKVTIQAFQFVILRHLLQIRISFHLFLEDKDLREEEMRSNLETFKKFCYRNHYQLPAVRKTGYLNLEKLIRCLVDYLTNPHKESNAQITKIREVASSHPLALSAWARQAVNIVLEE